MSRQVESVLALPDSEEFVRRGLGALEGEFRELALRALADWDAASVVSVDMFPAIAALQRPSWGSWNGLLSALRTARRNALKSRREGERERAEKAAHLAGILAGLDEPSAVDVRALSELLRVPVKKAKVGDVLALPISLRNRVAHDMPGDAAWWKRASAALRPLVARPAGRVDEGTEGDASPWVVVEGKETWSFNGLSEDFSAAYVSRTGSVRHDAVRGGEILQALKRLLGKAEVQESDFRRLLTKLAPEDLKGVMMGDFLVGRAVGSGGFAQVHAGRQLSTGRKVAVKILNDGLDETSRARFQQEAAFLAKFDHAHIVKVLGYGEESWSAPRSFSLSGEDWFKEFSKGATVRSFIALEWVEGKTLDEVFRGKRPGIQRMAGWFADAAGALSAVHEAGLIHRDVKPANLMVTDAGSIKLMDFGIARSQNEARTLMTTAGVSLGTPAYMSPEQIVARDAETEVGPATDVYSLCATFYELFTGKRLFNHDRESEEVVKTRKLRGESPARPRASAPGLPWELETILLGGLQRELDDRYRTAQALEKDLRHYQNNEAIEYRRPSLSRRAQLAFRRNRAVVLLGAAAILLGLAFGGWALAGSIRKARNIQASLAKARGDEAAVDALLKSASPDRGSKEDDVLERALTAARDDFNATLAIDAGNREAAGGVDRIQKHLEVLKASREKALKESKRQAEIADQNRKAQEEANELLEIGRKGVDAASRYLYDKNANYDELVKKVEVGQKPIEQAIVKAPQLALAHYLLGRCWDLRGWDDKAEACWRKAIELRPDFGPSHFELGQMLMLRSYDLLTTTTTDEERDANRPEARKIAQEASLELDAARKGVGFDEPLQRAVCDVMKSNAAGDADSFLRSAREGIKQFDGQPGVEEFHWLAGLASPSESPERLAEFERAIQLRPTHAYALYGRGTARWHKGDFDGALLDFTEALKIKPRFVAAYQNRSAARSDKGDLDGAIADETEALAINPRFAPAFFNRGNELGMKGDADGAIRDFSEVLKLNPRNAGAYCGRSAARLSKGDLSGAIQDCDEALKIDPACALAFANRGSARAANGDMDGAIHDCTEALKLDPRSESALTNRGAARYAKGDAEGALQDFNEILKINPHSPVAFNNVGALLFAKGDLDGAIEKYTEALKLDPRYADALNNRGKARKAKGDIDGSNQDFAEALKLNPHSAAALYAHGNSLLNSGDFTGAIKDYTEALKIDPRHADALLNRGQAHLSLGDWEGTIRDCTEAIKINPRFASAFLNRGTARRAKGDNDGAIQDYTEALKIDPRFDMAYYGRGNARQTKGDLDGAIEDHTEALKINPRYADAFASRGSARLAKGDFDGAIEDCNEALKLNSRHPMAFANRGSARQAKGDLAGMIDDYTKALEFAPANWPNRKQLEDALRAAREGNGGPTIKPREDEALCISGNGRYAKGDFDGAIKDFTDALKINPRYSEAFVGRGLARAAIGDIEGGIQDYTEAITINPGNAVAFVNRGSARQARADLDGAIQDFTEALKIDPKMADAFYNRSNARRAKGDTEGEIKDLNEAVKANPQFAGAFYNRGAARAAKGDLDGALQDYTEALKINPRYTEAYTNRGGVRAARRDFDGAIADYVKALEVAPKDWAHRKFVEDALRVAREAKAGGK